MAQIYEADEIVEVEKKPQAAIDALISVELSDAPAKNAVYLPVHYPLPQGKVRTVQVLAYLKLIEDPAVVPAPVYRVPAVSAPIAVKPVAEDPAIAVRRAAVNARLEKMREAMYSRTWPQDVPIPVPVPEEPAEEQIPLAEVAEQIVAEVEEKEPVAALSVEGADALSENAAAFAAMAAEAAQAQEEEEEEPIDPFAGLASRTFAEKLALLPEAMRARYDALDAALQSYEPVRIQEGKKYRTYKSGRVAILRMAIRGKTLSAYIALDPKAYADSKYVFTDESESTAFENYPMRMRLSSDRQERWAEELVAVIAEKNGIKKKPLPIPEADEEAEEDEVAQDAAPADPFAGLKRKPQKTFKQKLRAGSKLLRARYKAVKSHILTLERVRVIESSKSEIYRSGSTPIAKLVVKGKTLNAYLALPPAEYAETKYVFTDASEKKAYERYPMRVKLSSDRQEKWVKELVDEVAKRADLKKKEK